VRTYFAIIGWDEFCENPAPEGAAQVSPARQRWERCEKRFKSRRDDRVRVANPKASKKVKRNRTTNPPQKNNCHPERSRKIRSRIVLRSRRTPTSQRPSLITWPRHTNFVTASAPRACSPEPPSRDSGERTQPMAQAMRKDSDAPVPSGHGRPAKPVEI
jgi:hypothetical protein